MLKGKSFHTVGPETAKDLAAIVFLFVEGMVKVMASLSIDPKL